MDRDYSPDPRPKDEFLARDRQKEHPRELAKDRYVVSDRAAATLVEVGKFRTVATEDMKQIRYQGKAAELDSDLRSLKAQGLVKERTAFTAKGRQEIKVLVLTKAGKRFAESKRPEQSQEVYSGFVKPAEVPHDAAIYRMFQKESAMIESNGGKVRRIVLDYELKRRIYSPLAKSRDLPPAEYAKLQVDTARANYLKVVDGKIPLPDLRIEYETAEGDMTRVDLELATHHYHGAQLRMKAEAGFKLYGDSAAMRRTAVFEERDLMASIFSL